MFKLVKKLTSVLTSKRLSFEAAAHTAQTCKTVFMSWLSEYAEPESAELIFLVNLGMLYRFPMRNVLVK